MFLYIGDFTTPIHAGKRDTEIKRREIVVPSAGPANLRISGTRTLFPSNPKLRHLGVMLIGSTNI